MNWAAPVHAWLLLLAIPAVILCRRAAAQRRLAIARLAADGAWPGPAASRRRSGFLLAISFLLLVAALCRPQWGEIRQVRETRGADIVVALDLSRSMLADDVAPNRLAAARQALAGLLSALRGERIGLVAFAGSAFLVCPPTGDYGIFEAMLAEAGPDMMPLGGSALAGALREARRAFETAEGAKFLILISDGEDHGADAAAAAADLRRAGIIVHGVAVGTPAGGLIRLPGGDFLRDDGGAIVSSRARPEALSAIAAAGGGRLLDLAHDRRALVALHSAEMSTGKSPATTARMARAERFHLPLAVALLLLAIEPFLGRRSAP